MLAVPYGSSKPVDLNTPAAVVGLWLETAHKTRRTAGSSSVTELADVAPYGYEISLCIYIPDLASAMLEYLSIV